MNLTNLSQLFNIESGNNLTLADMEQCKKTDENSINFVSRSDNNNGISAFVKKDDNITQISKDTISIALSGSSVLASFYQPEPYYSGYHIAVLTPKKKMSTIEMLFYAMCIKRNRYRYNFGRQANKTLKDILIPKKMPEDYENISINKVAILKKDSIVNKNIELNPLMWKIFRYEELFDIERGKGPRKQDLEKGSTPFVTSSDTNNGVTGYTDHPPCHKGNTISVNRNGSIGEAFYQELDFCSTEDVHIFNPKFEMNKYIAFFIITLIKKEKYRFNYGRKWGIERMKESKINLPVTPEGNPDWKFMENFIKSLPYSKQLTEGI